ncbi:MULTISPECIES: hypothetical protein [Haloarcula]|nr:MULTISPECIES: hypothetical protein [Haloarcula]
MYREGTSYLFAGIPDLGNSIHININGDCNKSVPKSEILIISRI